MSKKKEKIEVRFMKENPKENAKEYRFSTIEEMFSFLTSENVDRFLSDLNMGIKSSVLMKEMLPEGRSFELDEMVWIDD